MPDPIQPVAPPVEESTSHIRLETWPPTEVPAVEVVAAPVAPVVPAATVPPAADIEEPPKGKDTPEKRIARASYHQRQAERKASDALAETDRLKAELAAARAIPTSVEPAAAVEPPKRFQSHEVWQADPTNADRSYEDYLDDRADFRAKEKGYVTPAEVETIASARAQALTEEAKQAARAAAEAQASDDRLLAFTTAREEAKTKYADYDTVVEQSELPTNPLMDQYVLRSGALAGELMYHLGTHPEDCQRIAALGAPAEVIEEMALIKHSLKGAPSSRPVVERKPVTKAPIPIQPLGTGGHASQVDLRSAPLRDFMTIRDEQDRQNAGRI